MLALLSINLKVLIIFHAFMGLILCVAIWSSGGWLLKYFSINKNYEVYYAYPLGLLFLVLLSLITLAFSDLVTSIFCSVAVVAWFLSSNNKNSFSKFYLQKIEYKFKFTIAVIVFFLSFLLGLRFHGPDSNIPSSVYGDLVTYVSFMSSYIADPILLPDLLVEGVRLSGYANGAPVIMGSALLKHGLVDPFLFLVVTVPVVGLISLGVQFSAFMPKRNKIDLLLVLIFPIFLIGFIPYIGYVTESPPTLLALPIIFAVYGLVRNCNSQIDSSVLALMAMLFVVMYLTKVTISLLLLIPLILILRNGSRLFQITVCASGALMILLILWKYSWVLQSMSFSPTPHRIVKEYGFKSMEFFRLCTYIFITTVLWAFVAKPYRLSLLIGCLGYMFLYSLMPLIFSAGILLSMFGLDKNKIKTPHFWVLILSSTILLVCTVVMDDRYDKFENAIALFSVLLMSSIIYFYRYRNELAFSSKTAQKLMTVGIVFFALVAIYCVYRFKPHAQENQLTPDDFDIWANVNKVTGENDLVFTNLTGLSLTLHTGWNSYAGIAQRQIYLAGWYNTNLRNDYGELSALLNNNQNVLSGVLKPDKIYLSKKYDNYYAVTSLDCTPKGFHEIYRNQKYVISEFTLNK